MIDFTNINLEYIFIHQVGNKLRDEGLKILNENISFSEEITIDYLLKYFLSQFNNSETYNFYHPSELELNEMYVYSKRLFSSPDQLYKTSIDISKRLYEKSTHPKINEGELSICYFKDCLYDKEKCDAIGIFKSEAKDVFLKFDSTNNSVNVRHDNGININKLDKGCLIFNLDKDIGYKICIVDTKSKDTQYWKDDFLKIQPASDSYHFTKNILSIAKEFVTNQLPNEFNVGKTEKIDLLNRSVEYFKSHNSFSKNEFEYEVFKDQSIISSFQNFNDFYQSESQIQILDNFEISSQAVKKQARAFKSVLKLDKNFHIYIHGNKELIEKGVENDGRKYYKIYYNDES